MQQYPQYSYYPQPGYPSTPHMTPSNGYVPFYQNNPNATPGYVPHTPYDSGLMQSLHQTLPLGRPNHPQRAATVPTPHSRPRKSAMKKAKHLPRPSTSEGPPIPPIGRPRKQSNSQRPDPRPSLGQPVIPASDPNFRPLHVFVSFNGKNELRLDNIAKLAIDEMRDRFLPLWRAGVEADMPIGYHWIIKFRDSPWDMDSPNVLDAMNLIVHLFTLFARRGFTFLSSINSNPRRLVFAVTDGDFTSSFFLAYLSSGGTSITLINPPPHIDVFLGAQLKQVLPGKIGSDHVVKDVFRVIQVKRRNAWSEPEVDAPHFFMHVLKIVSQLGYDLDATIPMPRRGPFGLLPGRELLVFKGAPAA